MNKYYFISFKRQNKYDGSVVTGNTVIDIHPFQYIHNKNMLQEDFYFLISFNEISGSEYSLYNQLIDSENNKENNNEKEIQIQ